MLWSVAARYSFTEAEIWAMPVSRLAYWYEGHTLMWQEQGGR